MTLDMLRVGETAKVESVNEKLDIYQRLIDIGVIENTSIQCVFKSPFENPKAFLVRGTVIAIRNEDAKLINITLGDGDTNEQF